MTGRRVCKFFILFSDFFDRKLHYDDLFSRRMLLSDEEVSLIMAASKLLLVLCNNKVIPTIATQISPARLGYMTYQEISGISIFKHPLSPLMFVPDDPPIATVMTLPGTRRRPVKPWHMCSVTEKVCHSLSVAYYDDFD